ncbi:MAG TPA: hypothetical protein VM367_07575 [Pseudonocardia sp.]|nr:hypothetical protein [Pseudonocardia sp.]
MEDEGSPILDGVAPAFEVAPSRSRPGVARPHDDREWVGALVLLTRGEVDLECAAGGRRRFGAGAVLWLTGLGLRALHNPGTGPAVLLAVTRSGPLPGTRAEQ